MPSLVEIQTAFQARMLTGADALLPMLGGGGRFIGVYENAYTARLLDVLAEDFPALHTLLGDEEFEAAMRAYIAANPSRRPSIRWLGERLPAWLAETDPWNDIPMLADMAAFEWMLGLAFDAPDAPVLDAGAMAAVAPEAWHVLGFVFHPALRTVVLEWDVVPFRQAVVEDREPEAAPELLGAPATWAAWRDPAELIVRYDRIEAEEAVGLAAARDGATFGELCELLAETGDPDTAAMRAATLLKGWLDRGWIAGLEGNNASWA